MERPGRSRSQWRIQLYALLSYAAIAVAFTWPLAVNAATHLTGPPSGDTGVYVWNQWVFQHELVAQRSTPYFTDRIFALGAPANLGLHNYTTFQNLVALPFIPSLGVVGAFNLVYLLMTVLTGYATFLLARAVTGEAAESWLAGLLFAWSPILVTRGGSHFSLVAAAPLAIFVLLLLRARERVRLRDGVALGVVCAWAASSDAYYGIYCVLIAAVFLLAQAMAVERRQVAAHPRAVPRVLDVLLVCGAALVLSIAVSGGWEVTFLGRDASFRTLYTPVLAVTILATARMAWPYRVTLARVSRQQVARILRTAVAGGLVAAALVAPMLYAVGARIVDGRWESPPIFWRSSPPGIDLISLVLPNPNHPLAPAAIREWLSPRADAYFENVASLTFVALIAMAAAWRAGWRIPRLWGALAIVFGALALGPFVHVAGVQTYVPGPWALLRYVPVVGMARTPGRFSIVLMLAVAVLFACALTWLARRWPQRRVLILSVAGAALVFELLPAPRPLYSAAVPAVYRQVRAAPADARLLELPFGVRDGTSSVGDFSARSQFFQTMHAKPLLGGYLSRVSRRRVAEVRRHETLDALIVLSEGRPLHPTREQALIEAGPDFVSNARVAFVIVDRARTPEPLRQFAIRAFRLELIERDGEFELYAPVKFQIPSSKSQTLSPGPGA